MAEPQLQGQTVQAAIAAVMAELPNISKGDKSPEGYQYRGIEQITKHVQPLLAKHGLTIAPFAEITDVRPSPAMKDGWQDVFMRVTWTVTGPDGSSITCQTTGIGRDRSDKGANKAQTQAFKYLLLHLFCVADGKDDADGQTYEQDREEAPPRASQEKQAKVLAEIADLADPQKDELAGWLKEQRISLKHPVTVEQLAAVQDRIDHLPATELPLDAA